MKLERKKEGKKRENRRASEGQMVRRNKQINWQEKEERERVKQKEGDKEMES